MYYAPRQLSTSPQLPQRRDSASHRKDSLARRESFSGGPRASGVIRRDSILHETPSELGIGSASTGPADHSRHGMCARKLRVTYIKSVD